MDTERLVSENLEIIDFSNKNHNFIEISKGEESLNDTDIDGWYNPW